MKKIIVLLSVILLVGCMPSKPVPDDNFLNPKVITDISEREVLLSGNTFLDEQLTPTSTTTVKTFIYTKDDIRYRIFIYGNGMEEAGLVVINETKDKLEMDYYKKIH